MFNLIRADVFKVRKSSAMTILLLIAAASVVTMAVMAHQIADGGLKANLSGLVFLFSDIDVISILGAVCAGVFICGDFGNQIIHDAIAGGCGRFSIVAEKMVVFLCAAAILLLPYFIAAGIGIGSGARFSIGNTGASAGFLHLLTTLSRESLLYGEYFKLFGLMLLLVIVYMAQLSICLPLAIGFKKPVIVVAVYYALSLLIGQLATLIQGSELFNNLVDCTPYSLNYMLPSLNMSIVSIWKAVTVSIIFTVIMLGISYALFRKAEIK